MATGEVRATMALTEPGGGSDLQAMRTTARRDGDAYVVNGSKTWITNARRSQLVALLCKTDPDADPPHRGVSILLVGHGPGFTVSRDLPKLGYKGVESCELAFDDFRVPATALLGPAEGHGFAQMMRGLEIGRIQVAARALGVGQAALEDSLRYAQQRESFGRPIWQHQSVGNHLADMATSLTAARQLVLYAARVYDSGERADLEAGMAKLFASETAMQIALDAVRVHGGYGYSTEFDVERYFRDAPLMIVGEGTNEIQRNVITRQLIAQPGAAMTGPPAGRASAGCGAETARAHAATAPRPAQDLSTVGSRRPSPAHPGLRRRDDGRRHDSWPLEVARGASGADPVYGVRPATVVTAAGVPTPARIAVYLVCLAAALVGFVLTFRDYSQPRRRDGR